MSGTRFLNAYRNRSARVHPTTIDPRGDTIQKRDGRNHPATTARITTSNNPADTVGIEFGTTIYPITDRATYFFNRPPPQGSSGDSVVGRSLRSRGAPLDSPFLSSLPFPFHPSLSYTVLPFSSLFSIHPCSSTDGSLTEPRADKTARSNDRQGSR